ncbi:AAA-domain-containing protein [Dothidotthia symphoricarpi CBS 119687]|uniref:AAA-domain-containing protein n=1 Tax=Dothidotthia symphoricarpi CBS 119687 TaxID=1392245 RepID=A0A6A6AIF9_9PLEO|nr:AAA-domain-containing protein [Dothidotthia symphoricarpi CBS 119687]KAF2130868.1 AAA-domain-containing protein [Dothidotthia symphoricarpi CBS 119687]
MYTIRPALRACTGRAPARLIRGRRYPSPPRLRTLHTTRALGQAAGPLPPPDENDVNNPTNDAPVTTDDPELLAQKLQRSRESSRRYSAALRRQQRGKKAQGLPPVHVPDWFLKRRVIRLEDVPTETQQRARPQALSVVVTHDGSGECASCSIPASKDLDAAQTLSRLVRGLWGRRLDDAEKRKVEKYLEERIALAQNAQPTKPSEGNEESDVNAEVEEAGKLLERMLMKREAAKTRQSRTPKHISALVLAEIRATVAASLATLRPSMGDSFPSTKTNLILHSPVAEHETLVDECVQDVALELGSDVIILRAQDLAQLAGDYLGEGPEPSPRSIRSLGYETYRLSSELSNAFDEAGADDLAEDDFEANQPQPMDQPEKPRMPFMHILALSPAMKALTQSLKGMQMPASGQFEATASAVSDEPGRSQSQSEIQLEDLKLATLLEALVDSNELKQSRGLVGNGSVILPPSESSQAQTQTQTKDPSFFDYSVNSEGAELELDSTLPTLAKPGISMAVNIGSSPSAPQVPEKSKIIYVKDYKELNATHYGGRIIQKLEELVRKRRSLGESIMIIGSTCSRELTPELSAGGVHGLQSDDESGFFRTIVMASESNDKLDDLRMVSKGDMSSDLSTAEKSKFQNINLLHIQDMLRCLDPVVAANIADVERSPQLFRPFASIFPKRYRYHVFTYDEVHRIALTALGLHITNPGVTTDGSAASLSWAHVALAMGLLKASDVAKYVYFDKLRESPERGRQRSASQGQEPELEANVKAKKRDGEVNAERQRNLQRIAYSANKHEKRLMPGIADPDQIKTTFEQVHVPKETVDSIRTITSLSLLRPDAFNYGILATEKISGALLYGPPGTGKTMLAKAVAKESGSTVLEVSGSQIMDKYVGEGEKNVAAVFSLARKLSPCIVFLDEADAIFASRDAMRERSSHRDILNQFLKEWDGLNDLSVFVMVATNRPFDLDDAVIRRLPRRLLVDLPMQADRKEILRIHLRGEQLDAAVDLDDMAKRTPFYSGSDLKNVAVSAALACVKEENEHAARAVRDAEIEAETNSVDAPETEAADTHHTEPPSSSSSTNTSAQAQTTPLLVRGQTYTFPAKRTLHTRHFDAALQEISASISEDMSSLGAIKKFDEQYGDKRGRKKSKGFGFGAGGERDERSARVRV